MSGREKSAWIAAGAVLLLGGVSAFGAERRFDPARDTPVYANETVFAYDGQPTSGEEGIKYTRRCFILCKGVLQFWRFAEFRPTAPPLDEAELEGRIRAICRIPPWSAREGRVEFPGFADLRELSVAHGDLLRAHMGAWLPTYGRWGNMRIMMPSDPKGRRACAEWLRERAESGEPAAVLLSRLPGMVHAVVIHTVEVEADGAWAFTVYDPNEPDQPRWLRFDPAAGRFYYAPTFYFRGGGVQVLRIYLSPLH